MSRRNVNRSQRVVVVVALAAALFVVGRWATSWRSPRLTGWTGYAPLQSGAPRFPDAGLHPWVLVLIWLVLVATWTIVSLVVLDDQSSTATSAPSD